MTCLAISLPLSLALSLLFIPAHNEVTVCCLLSLVARISIHAIFFSSFSVLSFGVFVVFHKSILSDIVVMTIPVNDIPQRGMPVQLVVGRMASLPKLSLVLWCALVAFSVISLKKEHNALTSLFTVSDGNLVRLKIPSGLDSESTRRLSLNLGGGACQWTVSLSFNLSSHHSFIDIEQLKRLRVASSL